MGLYLLYPMLYRITFQCPFLAVRTGLEPVTSCVTGRHSNQAELTHLVGIFLICGCKGNNFFCNSQIYPSFFTEKVA